MDPKMYTAAMEGKLDVLMNQYTDRFALQVTPNNNTVLHVVAEFGHSHCGADILTNCPSLLRMVNTDGDTPLHIAVAGGHERVVQLLIDFAKSQVEQNGVAAANNSGGGVATVVTEMLRARNRDGDTPLHLAARLKYPLGIVSLLTRADQWLDHGPNKAGETPLYLVVERECYDINVVSEILKNCKSPAYGGPGGRTAMHAAVTWGSSVDEFNKLLEWREDLIEEPDAYGWTPLHLATRWGNLEAVEMLLEKNKSVAYVATNNDRETALHIVAAVGDVRIMEELLSTCPDCWEMVNSKGQNILHIAADMESDEAAVCILEKPWVSRLINRKDNEGNTPLHVLASNRKTRPLHVLASKGKKRLSEYPGADKFVFNDETLTPNEIEFYEASMQFWPRETWDNPRDTVRKDQECIIKWKMSRKEQKERKENRKKERDEEMSKMANTHMIVATLISTISFAAGFTIPLVATMATKVQTKGWPF